MKKVTVLLMLVGVGSLSYSQQATIKGYLKGFNQSTIYLNIHHGTTIVRDSAKVQNGHFEFSVEAKEILAARLVTKDLEKKIFDKANNFYIPALQLLFFIEPFKHITINGDYQDWPIATIKGSNDNFILTNYYVNNKSGILKEREGLALAYNSKNVGDTVNYEIHRQAYLKLETANDKALSQLLKKYPASILAAHHVFEQLPYKNNEQDLEVQYNKFTEKTKKSIYGKAISKRLADLKGSAIGTVVKNFKVTGKDSIIDIQAYRGKYVLLDFWGSWCVPCREGHSHLNQLYATYKDRGFEIIGIAEERGEKARANWLSAIEKDGLQWVQILNDDAKNKDRMDLIKLFAITSYPTKILIDPDGVIILKPSYGSEELDNLLKKQLTK